MTHPENGRFTRTIVNRIWHRLMGRGIVHPVDAMQSEPWNADLLDLLATDIADHKYDLKRTIELIATSAAYQSRTEVVGDEGENPIYVKSPSTPCFNWRPPVTAVLVHSRSGAPNTLGSSPASFHALHRGGCNFLLMDGSTRVINDQIDLPAFRALCTRNNGEIMSLE
jgi:hypothetical protein